MSRACAACAAVNLPPCFGEAGCAYDGSVPGIGTVSLTRPTGKKALRRPGMPECMRLAAVSEESQKIGEFLDWLSYGPGYVLAEWDSDDGLERVWTSPQQLLARYYGIDLDRVERERGRMLAYLRQKGSA